MCRQGEEGHQSTPQDVWQTHSTVMETWLHFPPLYVVFKEGNIPTPICITSPFVDSRVIKGQKEAKKLPFQMQSSAESF